jgi:hypothetical protein
MRWSWKIGRLVGIDVYMHATFLLLVGFIFVATRVESHNVARTLFGVLFVLVIFACIVLHELGSRSRRAASASAHATSFCSPLAAWRDSSACRRIRTRNCWWRWQGRL